MPKLQEFEKIKTVDEHYELIQGLMGCAEEVLGQGDSKNANKIEKQFGGMIAMLTKSLKRKLKFVLKESRKYAKPPSLLERIKDAQKEREERKEEREERKRLKDEDYQAYLEWREAQEEQSEEDAQGDNSSLPAIRQSTSVEVVDEQAEPDEDEETEEE